MIDADCLYAGIDLGTSGCRINLIDSDEKHVYEDSVRYPSVENQTPTLWKETVEFLLTHVPISYKKRLCALAVDGTSGTLLLTDKMGKPSSPVLMYHDMRARDEAILIRKFAPSESGAHGAGSSLAKLLFLLRKDQYFSDKHCYALHQADWVSNTLTQSYGVSDENNCLKLGYDSKRQRWPKWLEKLNFSMSLLPEVYPPSTPIQYISPEIASRLGLPYTLKIVSGSTDSVAAFVATGASEVGEAVTSLGSSLVLKVLSDSPIFAPKYGVYSHRLGDKWLVGGASNTGGAVLKTFFSTAQLQYLSAQINPENNTGLDYYPLIAKGERFPINDPDKEAILSPKPSSKVLFLQAFFEGIAEIEYQGYLKLRALGAPFPSSIQTVGGGSCNQVWSNIRRLKMKLDIHTPKYREAAYGAAKLASGKM